MLVTKQFWLQLTSIFIYKDMYFYVLQKKEGHNELEHHEG